jgi:hypothetical protein
LIWLNKLLLLLLSWCCLNLTLQTIKLLLMWLIKLLLLLVMQKKKTTKNVARQLDLKNLRTSDRTRTLRCKNLWRWEEKEIWERLEERKKFKKVRRERNQFGILGILCSLQMFVFWSSLIYSLRESAFFCQIIFTKC